MPSPPLSPSRVARILTAPSRDGKQTRGFASGYRISPRLILTVAHTLDGRKPYEVDLNSNGDRREAEEVWRDDDRDIALLSLDSLPPGESPRPVRLGRVDSEPHATISVETIGYPDYAEFGTEDEGGSERELWRGRDEAHGTIRTAETGLPGTLRAHLDRTPARVLEGSPWKGMSGAPVFSRSSNLLVGVVRNHHLPAGASTMVLASLDGIDDPEWREALDTHGIDPDPCTETPDEWEETGLQPYASYLEERIAASPGLQEKTLPFVRPDHEEQYAPSKLLAQLGGLAASPESAETSDETGNGLGIVVVGIPGSGKTRLLAETAARAGREGWRVLHLGKPMLVEASKQLDELSERVLLVVEDIAELAASIDSIQTWERIRREAGRRGPALALLAESRTTAVRDHLASLLDSGLLRRVNLPYGGSYHDRIRRQVVRTLARNATDAVGQSRMEQVCGDLPALSVVFASYYDDQIRRGRGVENAIPLNTPGVGGWIQDVLRSEELTAAGPKPSDPDPRADPRLVATARATAIAPHTSSKIARQLEPPLANHPTTTPGVLLERLENAGLWSIQDGQLRVVHDVFADHLLRELVCQTAPATGAISLRTDRLSDVLAAGLLDHRALGNLVRSLERLRDVVNEDRFGQALDEAVQQWCASQLDSLGQILAHEKAAGTLTLLLETSGWREVLLRFQDQLARPWLRRNYQKPGARDAVFAAAQHLDGGFSYLTGWLMKNSELRRAAYLFPRIASMTSSAWNPQWAAELALDHLTNQALHRDASFVLAPLLDTGSNLHLPWDHPHIQKLIGWARRWLAKYAEQPQATYVAGPLVLRPELRGAALANTVAVLLDKVAGQRQFASYVYVPVLQRQRRLRDVPEPLFDQTIADALAWFEEDAPVRPERKQYGLLPAAGYVLPELIAVRLPWKKTLSRVLMHSWKWLERNGERPQAGRLIATLLDLARSNRKAEERLDPTERELLADHVRAWLDSPPSARSPWRKNVLGKTLSTNLFDDDADALRRYAADALRLYDNTPTPERARTVLPPLLGKSALPPDLAARAISRACARLDANDEHSAYLLTPLLRRQLDPERRADVLDLTLRWLSTFPSADGSFRLLTTALRSRQNTAEDREKVADRAVAMVSGELLEREDQLHLVLTLCQHRAELPTVWNRFVGTACTIFDRERKPSTAMRILRRMLSGEDALEDQVVAKLHTSCLNWCQDRPRSTQPLSLLPEVLASRRLSTTERQRASELGLDRLEARTETTNEGGKLLLALLLHGELDGPRTDTVVDFSIRWLNRNEEPRKVIEPLIRLVAGQLLRDLDADRDRYATVDRMLEYLAEWPRRNPDAKPEQRAAISDLYGELANRRLPE